MTAILAWAIKAPDWSITAVTQTGYTDNEIKNWLISDFEEFKGEEWEGLESEGFRCVRVSIQEIESTAAKEA